MTTKEIIGVSLTALGTGGMGYALFGFWGMVFFLGLVAVLHGLSILMD